MVRVRALLLPSLLFVVVQADWVLEVLLLKYSNPQSLALANVDSFGCCDTDGVRDGECKNECDNILQFCLQTSSYKSPTISTSVITGDNLTFSAGQNISAGVPNPLMFTGNTWPSDERWKLTVNITDDDNDSSDPLNFDRVDDLVSSILVSEALHTAVVFTERRSYSNHESEITLSFRLSCATDYFGEDCSIFCRPQNGSRGHFSCDRSGNMTCLPGYSSPAANCTIPICARGCSSTGVCVAPGECRCEEGWGGEDCSIQCEHQQPNCERTNNTSPDDNSSDQRDDSDTNQEASVTDSSTATVVGVTVSAVILLMGSVGGAALGAVLCWQRRRHAMRGDHPTGSHSPPNESSGVQDEETSKALDNPLYSSTEVPEQLTDNLSASKTSVYCLAGPSSDEAFLGLENNHTPGTTTVTNSGSEEDSYDYAYVWTIPSVNS